MKSIFGCAINTYNLYTKIISWLDADGCWHFDKTIRIWVFLFSIMSHTKCTDLGSVLIFVLKRGSVVRKRCHNIVFTGRNLGLFILTLLVNVHNYMEFAIFNNFCGQIWVRFVFYKTRQLTMTMQAIQILVYAWE